MNPIFGAIFLVSHVSHTVFVCIMFAWVWGVCGGGGVGMVLDAIQSTFSTFGFFNKNLSSVRGVALLKGCGCEPVFRGLLILTLVVFWGSFVVVLNTSLDESHLYRKSTDVV